jgi:hypothetical protein
MVLSVLRGAKQLGEVLLLLADMTSRGVTPSAATHQLLATLFAEQADWDAVAQLLQVTALSITGIVNGTPNSLSYAFWLDKNGLWLSEVTARQLNWATLNAVAQMLQVT